MKKLSKTESGLKKSVAYKKKRVPTYLKIVTLLNVIVYLYINPK